MMCNVRFGVLTSWFALLLVCETYSIVTPFHPVPECSSDAALIVPNFKANWFKAVEYCHYLGRSLVTLASEQSQKAVDHLLDGGTFPRDQLYWSGASDLADAGNVHWHYTGRPVSIGWTNWRDELHRREASPDVEDAFKVRCVSMVRTGDVVEDVLQQQVEAPAMVPVPWTWMLSNCWKELYFICERTGPGCR